MVGRLMARPVSIGRWANDPNSANPSVFFGFSDSQGGFLVNWEMSAESEDQFTAACAGQLFWEPGSCAHDGDHLGAVLKVHTGRMTTEQLRALLEQSELWKTDTTGFSIPEISFEEVEGTARVCSLWDFVSETADKLDAASNMFRGAAARNVLQAAAVLREIASGSASRPLTL